MEKPLEGKVAIVAGATRGAGRAIARTLAEEGAVVYATGRTTRAQPNSDGPNAGRPETIEETVELIERAGGTAVAVRVDHRDDAQVASLFKRVKKERKRLDILVNVMWAGPDQNIAGKFWKQPLELTRAFVEATWPHIVTTRHAAALMSKQRSGLIVQLTEMDHIGGYRGSIGYDLARTAEVRLAYALAEELAEYDVTSIAVTPGFMRTEVVLDHLKATEENWRTVAESSAQARAFGFAGSESPFYVARAIAALAADPHAREKSGGLYGSWTLAEEYGVTDIDGTQPNWGRYGVENFPQFFAAPTRTGRTWKIVPDRPVPSPAPIEAGVAVG